MIKVKRKYIYEYSFIVRGLYNGLWEDETAEDTRREGLQRLVEYRANMPQIPHKLVCHLESKTLKEGMK